MEAFEFERIREEKKTDRLKVLLEAAGLYSLSETYDFGLNPENLNYDRNYRVSIKNKEPREKGAAYAEGEFLKQYKALVGHAMQKRYAYEDYLKGGEDLYRKNPLLKRMDTCGSLEEVTAFLEQEYETRYEIQLHKRVEVNRSWYRLSSWCMAAAILLIAAALICLFYLWAVLIPRENAMLRGMECYLDGNDVKVIDELREIDMKYLNRYQKYILAVSYVRSESLTPEQKENVLETLTIDGEEKLKDYWIYLGRLNTAEAENIAMQRSDDELLLYACMTEKAILEKNTEISGEEKTQRLTELEKKIEELAGQYEEPEEE